MARTKKSKLLAIVLTLAMVVSMLAGFGVTASADTDALAAPVAYNGQTAQGDYTISTATQLDQLATAVSNGTTYGGSTFTQLNNITVNNGWAGIGTPSITTNSTTSSPMAGGNGFGGTYNGGNYTITIARTASVSGVGGVFNYVWRNGTIQNLTVAGTLTVTGGVDAVGGVVGYNSGTLNKLTNNVTVNASNAFNVGGIVGFHNSQYYHVGEQRVAPPVGVLVNCANTGAVTGRTKVGGIAGQNSGVISYSSNTGAIHSTAPSGGVGVGGIVGRNGNNNAPAEMGFVTNCFNRGTITMAEGRWGGGIVGFENEISYTDNCYSTSGTITGAFGFWNTVVGSTENPAAGNYVNYAYTPTGTATSPDPVNYLMGTNPGNMTSATFATTLNNRYPNNQNWTWTSGVNDNFPYHLRTAPVPTSHGMVSINDYSVVYVSNSGSDAAAGNDPDYPVKTLSRAAIVATLSENPNVYIYVKDALTVATEQSAFGNGIPVVWKGSTGTMITVSSGGSLTIGGLYIDGSGVTTAVQVNSGGYFISRNNGSISNCGTAVNVASGGNVTINRSAIGGTTSISLTDATSSCTLFAGPDQATAITGSIYLGSFFGSDAFLKIGSSLENIVGSLRISSSGTASGRNVASVTGSYAAFTNSDLSKFAYSGGGHGFVLATNNTHINLA